MTNKDRRVRLLVQTAVALAAVWAVALAIFHFSARAKMTADRVEQFVAGTDLSGMSADEREKAIEELAREVNALSPEERMKWRLDNGWKKWFAEMSEGEKAKFINATLPSGVKQMMDTFSQLPAGQRKKMIDDALKKLQAQGAAGADGSMGNYGPNGPPPLSPELEQQVRQIGLNQFYANSSAETKAELAPLLEQMQTEIRQGRIH